MGDQLQVLAAESGDVCEGVPYVSLDARVQQLRALLAKL